MTRQPQVFSHMKLTFFLVNRKVSTLLQTRPPRGSYVLLNRIYRTHIELIGLKVSGQPQTLMMPINFDLEFY